jgi:hypothetical protein
MSELKVKTVVDTTLARGNLTQADLSAVRDSFGVHKSKKEKAQVERLMDAFEKGSVKVLAPENPYLIKMGLESAASPWPSPAASFRDVWLSTIVSPGLLAAYKLVGTQPFWGWFPALVVATTTSLLLSPVTVPLGSILGVAAALKD